MSTCHTKRKETGSRKDHCLITCTLARTHTLPTYTPTSYWWNAYKWNVSSDHGNNPHIYQISYDEATKGPVFDTVCGNTIAFFRVSAANQFDNKPIPLGGAMDYFIPKNVLPCLPCEQQVRLETSLFPFSVRACPNLPLSIYPHLSGEKPHENGWFASVQMTDNDSLWYNISTRVYVFTHTHIYTHRIIHGESFECVSQRCNNNKVRFTCVLLLGRGWVAHIHFSLSVLTLSRSDIENEWVRQANWYLFYAK